MKDKPDRIIHEAMGLCWHEPDMQAEYCDSHSCCMDSKILGTNPDYAKDLRPVFEWMRTMLHTVMGFEISNIDTFDCWLECEKNMPFTAAMNDGPEVMRDLIAQWIESTRE